MSKEELFKKISEVQDLIVSLYGCEKTQTYEQILMAADALVTVKTNIEVYYRFIPEGA